MQTWTLKRILQEVMTPTDREAFFTFCASELRFHQTDPQKLLLLRLLRETGFRRDTLLRRLPPNKLAELIGRSALTASMEKALEGMLAPFHLNRRRELMGFCLDAWGIKHDDGALDGTQSAPSPDEARRVFPLALQRFPESHVRTYFAAQGYLAAGGWRDAFWPLLDEPAASPLAAIADKLPEAPPDAGMCASIAQEAEALLPQAAPAERTILSEIVEQPKPGPAEPSRLVTLDRLLISESVRAVAGEIGALTIDQIQDAVDELVAANSRRYQSYFHRGYIDGLLERPLAFFGTEMNAQRKVWVLAGYITARTRDGDYGGIIRTVKDFPDVFAAFADPAAEEAARAGVRLVIDAFAAQRASVELAGFISHDVLQNAGEQAYLGLLELARDLYRSRSAVEADRLLEILEQTAGPLTVPSEILNEVLRRRAQCRKAVGAFSIAIDVFEGILPECGPEMRSSVLCDIGLARGSFKWLVEVRPPKEQKHVSELLRRLGQGNREFSEALQCLPLGDANAPYVLGMRALLASVEYRENGADATALNLLRMAYEHAIRRLQIYRSSGVFGPLCFAYGCAVFLALDEEQFENASEILRRCVDDYPAADWADWLLEECVAVPLEVETGAAAVILLMLYDVRPSVLWSYLENRLPSRVPVSVLRHPLCQEHLEQVAGDERRASRLRWKAGVALARCWAAAAGKPDWDDDRHSSVVELLLELARRDSTLRPDMVRLLVERELIEAIWDEGERLRAQAALAAWDGRLDDAMGYLLSACRYYRDASDLDAAADIAAEMREYEPAHPMTVQAASLLPAATLAEPLAGRASPLGRPLKILFVGGNEMQEQYETDLKADLAAGAVPIEVDFEFTGWSSNWGRQFEKLAPRLASYDGVVVMQFVRTQLGRTINAEISRLNTLGHRLLWRRCTGHGKQSMQKSIEACAAMVLDLHANTDGDN